MGVRAARVNWYKRHTAHPLASFSSFQPPSFLVFSLCSPGEPPSDFIRFRSPGSVDAIRARGRRSKLFCCRIPPIKMPRGAGINLGSTSIPSNVSPTRPDKCTFLQIEIEDRPSNIGSPFPPSQARFYEITSRRIVSSSIQRDGWSREPNVTPFHSIRYGFWEGKKGETTSKLHVSAGCSDGEKVFRLRSRDRIFCSDDRRRFS